MDLRSGHTFWPLVDPPQPKFPALTDEVACDVAIIGAGISGAMAAYELARAGLRVVVADRRQPGRGSTAASTALLLCDLDKPLHELAKSIGDENAGRCYRMGSEAIERIAAITSDLLDPCGFERRPSLLLAHDQAAADMLERELIARREAGLEVTALSRREIEERYSFTAPGALWSSKGAEVDAYALTHALLDDAIDHGALIFGDTRVGIPETGPPYHLMTDAGGSIFARNVVLAGGYEAVESLRVVGKLVSTYAVATMPIQAFKGWPDRSLIWTTSKPYLYLRTTADGRAMIGGGDENTTDPDERDALIGEKAAYLMARFWHMFPALKVEAEFAWAGFFIETPDALPYIGKMPGRENLYLSLCYGANGTTFAAIGARVLRELIVDRSSKDAELLSPHRGE